MIIHKPNMSAMVGQPLCITIGNTNLFFQLIDASLLIAEKGQHPRTVSLPIRDDDLQSISVEGGKIIIAQPKADRRRLRFLIDVPREIRVKVHKHK